MNCRNFEAHIDDMARGALMDAQTREAGLRHAAECVVCAARLDDERSLTAGLRSLASLTADASAPPRVEAALLAAFRARRHTSAATAADAASPAPAAEANAPAAPVPFLSRARGPQWWLPRWAQGGAVAAASALLVFGLYAFMREQQPPPPQPATVASTKDAPSAAAPTHDAVAVAPPVEDEIELTDAADDAGPKQRATGRSPSRGGRKLAGGRRPNAFDAGNNDTGAETAEIATEFIPLVGGGRLAPGDAGHLMRVEVPRTALASFGLPVNADHSGGRVKADVLMGEDGIARAIRFVR